MNEQQPKYTTYPWEVKSAAHPSDKEPDTWLRVQSEPKSTSEKAYNIAYMARGEGQSGNEIEANARLIAAAPLMLKELQRVEWLGNEDFTMCPNCWRYQWNGHATDCTLDATIKAATGE